MGGCCSVDDEYNGVVIRGECYDRQFMFGKGAGGLPTASSILSDVTARLHNYRYEYKKMSYEGRPAYTTDVSLRIYLRHKNPDVPYGLKFDKILERYISDHTCYTVGDLSLAELMLHPELLSDPDVFICNIPRFFESDNDGSLSNIN